MISKKRKVATTVYLTVEQDVGLQELRERTHRPVAEMIRAAIDAYLSDHLPPVDKRTPPTGASS